MVVDAGESINCFCFLTEVIRTSPESKVGKKRCWRSKGAKVGVVHIFAREHQAHLKSVVMDWDKPAGLFFFLHVQ